MSGGKSKPTGTREWASSTLNIQNGCEHHCRYCYGRHNAKRFGNLPPDGWAYPVIDKRKVDANYGKRKGVIMFPSAHDITLKNIDECKTVLWKLLCAGNQVLIVSKPNPMCIKTLCDAFQIFRDQILFRFTITARDRNIVAFWEPGAPSFYTRKEALMNAKEDGYRTSVSMEPLLEREHVEEIIQELDPWVTDSIWIGAMNQIGQRVEKVDPERYPAEAEILERELPRIRAGQTPEKMKALYEVLRYHPKVKWKDSYKKVLGLPAPVEVGMDV